MTKKQYTITLTYAVIFFCIVFIVFYQYTYKKNVNQTTSLEKAELVEAFGLADEDNQSLEEPKELIDKPSVQARTKIIIRVLDQDAQLRHEITLNPMTLLGLNEQQIKERFRHYKLQTFTEDEVILLKIEEREFVQQKFKIGMQNNDIGIVVEGKNEQFIPLHLSAKNFSKATNVLFLNEAIEISKLEKEKLQKNPYYIEEILQNYAE